MGPSFMQSILLRRGQGVSKCHPTGHNRDSMNHIHIRTKIGYDRVSCLVIGGHFPIKIALEAFLLRTQLHLGCRLLEVAHINLLFVLASRQYGCLIEHVFDISAGKSNSALGDLIPINGRCEWLSPCVNLENIIPTRHIRKIENYSAVKASRSKQGGIEKITAIGVMVKNRAFTTKECFIVNTAKFIYKAINRHLAYGSHDCAFYRKRFLGRLWIQGVMR